MLVQSIIETLQMLLFSFLIAIFFGTPLAICLRVTGKGMFYENFIIHYFLEAFISLGRSIPFIILMVALIPLTRFIVGSSIGTAASVVPLGIAAIPFFARLMDASLAGVDEGLIEAGKAMGLSPFQIISKILLLESLPSISHALCILLVTLTEYTAMAGALGGGGLGSMAIQYGYYQFNTSLMLQALAVLVAIVLVIQFIGNFINGKLTHSI